MCGFGVSTIKNLEKSNSFCQKRGPDFTSTKVVNGVQFLHNLLHITGTYTPQPFHKNDIACVFNGDTKMFNIKNYEDVPGMILTSQCEDIIKIAKQLPENSTVIEIGCAWGKSTWCWIEGLPKGSTLITIDVFVLDEKKGKHKNRQQTVGNPVINTIMEYWMQNTGYDTLLKVLEEHPRKDFIKHKIYKGTSDSFDLENITYLDCVYIDGNHKYQFVKNDLEKFGNISNIVCGDDYKPLGKSGPYKPQVGVVQAVDEFCKKTGRKFWTDPESFFWTALK